MSRLEWWRDTVTTACSQGRLGELLETLPRDRWDERGPYQRTLLHYASYSEDNAAAAAELLAHGLDVNTCDHLCETPSHHAARQGSARVLEVLCAAGADLLAPNVHGATSLSLAIVRRGPRDPLALSCVRVLVANGVRLSSACPSERLTSITPEMEALERGVLRCRSAVVLMLGLKRRRGPVMRELDRFVVRQVALAIWATRCDKQWQSM